MKNSLARLSLSIFLSVILILQLISPTTSVFAIENTNIPTNPTVSLYNTNDIYLRWDPVSGAERYKVYRIIDGKKELVSEGVTTYWWKSSASEGSYSLVVTAIKYGIESEMSSPVNFEINFPKIQSPNNITYTLTNINDLQLKWGSVTGAIAYNVYKIIGDQKKFVTSTYNTIINFSGLEEGNHIYEISALSGRFGESLENNQITISVVYPEFKSPSNLRFTLNDFNNVNLLWDPVKLASQYKIYKVTDSGKSLVSTTSNTNKYLTNLPEGEHVFEVSAVSGSLGETKDTSVLKISIDFPNLVAPRLTSTLHDTNNLFLIWEPVEFATSYNIYQVINNQKELLSNTASTMKYFPNLAEGEYEYLVSAVHDRFGESVESNIISTKIEFPEINVPDGLTATINNTNDIKLEWQPVEFATSYNIYQIINNEKSLITSTSSTNMYFSNLPEGEHVYEVSAVNNRFGESKEINRVIATIIYPKLEAPYGLVGDNMGSDGVNLQWDTAEYATSYNVYEIVNGDKKLVSSTYNTSARLFGLTEGEHFYEVTTVSNRFGESSPSSIVKVNIKPLLEEPLVESPEVNGDNVKLDWQPVAGAESYNIYEVVDGKLSLVANTKETELTIENLIPENYEYRIVPVSPAGIEGEKYTTVLVEVEQTDTTPPQTVANETNIWQQVEYKVVLTATDDQSGVAKTFYSINGSELTEGTSFTVSEEGVNTVSFYSIDNAGNVEEVKTTEVKIDKTAPVTNSDIATNWNKGKVAVKLTATDDLSGVAKTFYSIDGSAYTEGNTFTISTEGITQVSFYSVDNAGNKEEAKIEEVMIDNTAPVTKSDITDQWNKDAVSVNLTATDNLSGVAKTYYSINGSEYLEGTSFTVTGEGVIQVSFYSVDNAGNEEAVKTEFIKLDNQAPETVSDVTDKWNTGDVKVNLTATDNESGVATTFYSINGSEFVEGTEFTVSQEGINKVSFYSVDNVGNIEVAKTVDVKVDKTAPTTVSNITDKWNQSQVAVKLTATDELSGVAKTYYSINGTDYVEGSQFNVSQEGINKVSFYSVDNAGNIEEVQTAEVKVDKTAPVVSWNLADQYALGDSLPLAYKATDEHSGIAKETISVNGKVHENANSLKLDKPGAYEVVVTVTDYAGWTTTIEKTIEVYIPATLIVNPGVIKANAGDFTVKISLPKGYNTNQIDLSTATLNGVSAKSGTNGLVQQAKNGQFKFNRDDFDWKKGMVTVEFRVLVDGILVIGSTTVEVK
jgi:large repetitive protein